jgi:2-oxoglutarate ferredoxin oxidoreductase subunit alpha
MRDLPEQVHTLIVPELNIGRVVHEVEHATAGRREVLSLPKLGGLLHTPGEILEAIERRVP